MQKRVYMSGYNIEWKKGSHKSDKQGLAENKTKDKVNTKSENNLEPLAKMEPAKTLIENNAEVNNDNLIASAGNSIIPVNTISNQQKDFLVNPSSDDCDNIVLKSGDEIKAKVTEITSDEIKYKKCDNLTGPTYSINKSEVFLIKYANGTKDIITTSNSTPTNNTVSSNNANDKPKKNKGDKKSGAFGIVSFVCSIIGLLVAGIVFGPLAIIFGIIGMINRKLKGLAIAGLIIGIIDTIFAILILAAIIASGI
jgi:hypothetical protein